MLMHSSSEGCIKKFLGTYVVSGPQFGHIIFAFLTCFTHFVMCKVKQMGNTQVVNKNSVHWKNTVGILPPNHRVAPSLRAAGSISDRGVRVYWWKCRNWPSELQKKKSSAQYFTFLYLLFFFGRPSFQSHTDLLPSNSPSEFVPPPEVSKSVIYAEPKSLFSSL